MIPCKHNKSKLNKSKINKLLLKFKLFKTNKRITIKTKITQNVE